ncbi:UDP-3-O-(3-hydroxymyristoyl)glucosamine N-acyltransferase [Pseudodesulfovibrio senegalensis]|jgi:UDP-3-O-[3-hydroxymyristoyl] glucosamine N-acyltransferase|uniref:UDP-3-O-acylglucosamine N-acyltransferase n=1 Tax=Pseudodesulfovibrio senegalensis TaxID=1721087 RepID=A0A6N6N674_9BACT|nr:UDP-3-O-(3-hydroxymyristoyl)glucosamine N-acyltransferase [Pseudodesulfovibrio senegalensis]KAB1443682.1 UDP-3-O-(3-hydroxymyristoyl)glucosamine N-acyltransferase [Pseudodesulfovibrio senegalensis]
MTLSLSSIAEQLGLEFTGEDKQITGVNTLEKAGPGDVSFLVNPKYARLLETTSAGAVLTGPDYADRVQSALISSNVYLDLAKIVKLFEVPQGRMSGTSELSCVHESADIAESATVYPFAFIGENARIGEDTVIFPGCYVGESTVIGRECIVYPNAVLMGGCELGDNSIIQPGAVIGADGFGYAQTPFGHMKIPQIGKVCLGDNVEIGANTAVDRAALDVTSIGPGTKIDNLVQVGHNVQMGKHCLVVGQVGIGGSTTIGDNVVLGGQAGIADNVTIGSNVKVGGQAGISNRLDDGSVVSGSPSMPYSTYLKAMGVCAPKLPDLFKKVKKLEKRLATLEEAQGDDHDKT